LFAGEKKATSKKEKKKGDTLMKKNKVFFPFQKEGLQGVLLSLLRKKRENQTRSHEVYDEGGGKGGKGGRERDSTRAWKRRERGFCQTLPQSWGKKRKMTLLEEKKKKSDRQEGVCS